MKAQVEEKISKIKELLSAQPVNNSKNREIYKNKLQDTIDQCQSNCDAIIEEFKERLDTFNGQLQENAEIGELEKKMDDLVEVLRLSNPVNLPFNVLNIDKSLYLISKYYKSDLDSLNENIANILDVFKRAKVMYKSDDFKYTPYVKKYMDAYFRNETSSKFESIYSECPNLITHIKLCLWHLYNSNIRKINKFIEFERKKINCYDANVEEYQSLKMRYDASIACDRAINTKRFMNKELKVSDYAAEKMSKLILQFGDEKNIEAHISKFYYAIEEYKKYLHYKYLIDSVKKIFDEKGNYKSSIKNKLRDINKNEKKLFKLSKARVNKDLEIENCINELNTWYRELDELTFKDKISKLKEDTNIIDILSLAMSNYRYLVKCFEENGIEKENYEQEIEGLFSFILSPYNTLINYLNFTQEHEFANIIGGKYHLLGLNISADLIDVNNLDSLLESSKVLIDYEAFKNMKLDLESIDSYCQIQELISKY